MMKASDHDGVTNTDRISTPEAPPPIAGSRSHAEYQRIWLATQSQAWRTLAIVPVDDGVSTFEVASLITTLGVRHGEAVSVADLRDVQIGRVPAFLEVAGELVSRGQRVVFATSSITENLATIPLARIREMSPMTPRAADGVVLCVSIGATSLGSIEATIEQIGKERFLGSILLKRPHRGARGSASSSTALRTLQARP